MRIAIKGKKIFTGLDVIENGIVLLEGNNIAAVGPADKIKIPQNAELLNFSDGTVLPGLIDVHSHCTLSTQEQNYAASMKDPTFVLLLRGARNIRLDLASGVTTLRTLGEPDFTDAALKDATEKGIIPGPRLLISGKGIRTSYGHGIMGTPFDGPDAIKKAARINIHDAGADQIKLFVSGSIGEFRSFKFGAKATVERNEMQCLMTKEEIEAAVHTAHSVGKRVAAHCYGGIGLKYCVEAGVDGIEHGIYMDDDDMELMLKSGTWLTFTSNSYLNDQRLINRGTPELTTGFVKFRDAIRTAYQKACQSDIKYAFGTDGQHGEFAFELESLVGLGAKNLDVLEAATRNAAALCCIEDKVGTLEPGKLADVIVVTGDPLNRISDIRNIAAVFKDGDRMDQISRW